MIPLGKSKSSANRAYSVNNITANDGSVDIEFGGCDGKISNCADHARLELHRAPLSPAASDP